MMQAALILSPVVTFVSLSLLPPGRAGRIGVIVAIVVLAVLWLRTESVDRIERLVLSIFLAAVSLAALMQAIRAALPANAPRYTHPALVSLLALAGLIFLFTRIGA